jgi:hypothetical protein
MYRDADLLKLAQGQKCLLECHPYCLGDEGSTTVAAHSNQLIHGKGRGLKADDCMTVWACHRCHEYLDSGDFLSKKEKAKLFDNSWYRQVGEWWAIADTISTKPWKVEAALRVLQHIGAKR